MNYEWRLNGWHLYTDSKLGTTALDLALQGTVTQVVGPPATPPMLSEIAFTTNQFSFSLTGTPGTNYVVQATTNLNPAIWISLTTNTAPFTFAVTNINAFSQRFYRGLIAQ